MILIEAPSSAYHRGIAGVGETASSKGGDRRRFYTKPPHFYWGIDWHARSLYVCILSRDGAMLVHRHRPAAPEPFLTAMAPYRDGLVGAVECLFPGDWRAALWAQEGLPFVLGHALSMKASHGGKAKHDTSDAPKMAVLLRGAMLPPASVYPAQRRATRAQLRRRIHLLRQRAELLAHVHQTNSPYNLPDMGQKIA